MINFVGNVQSKFGRGKDKAKRKSRVNPLVGAGALVGAGRGFVQENKMKKKGNFNQYSDNTSNYAFSLSQRGDRKAIKRSAKLGGRVGALAGAAYSLKNSKSIKNAALMGVGGAVGGSILASGATGVNKLLKRKTIKIGKKSIINYSNSGDISEFAFSLPLLQPKPKKSRVGLKTGAITGLIGGGITGAATNAVMGASIDRQIDKEKERFQKTGARSRAGKIGNDARIGARTVGGMSAVSGALKGAFNTPGSIKKKIANAAMLGISSGVAGGLAGGLTGSGVGLVRGFRQPNKKKK